MLRTSPFVGLAAVLLFGAAANAQTNNPATGSQPTDQATRPLSSTTPSGTPYSESGGGLPPDPSSMGSMSAGRHGTDSAAQTRDSSETARIERCKAMPHDQMMQNAGCAALAKKHPTMMNGGSPPQ